MILKSIPACDADILNYSGKVRKLRKLKPPNYPKPLNLFFDKILDLAVGVENLTSTKSICL